MRESEGLKMNLIFDLSNWNCWVLFDHQGQEGLGEDQEMSFEHIEYEMPIQLSGVYTV